MKSNRRTNPPLARAAKAVAKAGRHGDTVIVHMSPEEFMALKRAWGEPTINPVTGQPEYFRLGRIFRSVAPILAAVAAPFLAPAIGGALGLSGALGSTVGSALLGAGAGGLSGGARGALMGGLTGGIGSAIAPVLGNTFAGIAPETAAKFGITGGADTIFGGGASLLGGAPGSALTVGPGTTLGTNAGNMLNAGPTGGVTQGGMTVGGAGMPGATVGAAPVTPSALASSGMTLGGGAGMEAPVFDFGSRLTDPGGGSKFLASPLVSGAATAAATAPAAAQQGSWLSRNWMPLAAGGVGLAALGSMGGEQQQPVRQASTGPIDQGPYAQPLNLTDDRETVNVNMPTQDWYTYGRRPEVEFFRNNRIPVRKAAHGGLMRMANGSYVPSQGNGGQDDKIPAVLSDGEYVMDATTVSDLGDGNPEAGAKKLDRLRDEVAKQKGRRERVPPKAHASPLQYLRKVG